jgi:hypothetical protein
MLALFRNPLLCLLGRLWWLPALTLTATWGLGGEQGLRWAGLGVAAYLAASAGMIVAAWAHGAYALLREHARRRSAHYRFLCPHCLRFGGFHFACGACGKKVEAFLVHTNGAYVNDCPHCHAHLLSREAEKGSGVRAYCEWCKGNCDCAIHHQRQVRALATLLPADFTALCQTNGTQEQQAQGGIGYAYNDGGARLTYLLNLNSLTETARELPHTHALRELKSIWLNAAGDNNEAALKVGEAADRFDRQTSLAKTLTVCVPQTNLNDALRNVLETRFKAIKYGVTPEDFLRGEQTGDDAPPPPPALPPTAHPAAEIEQAERTVKEKDEIPV